MSQRIFMTITRDMTDKTLVCVFPWEKPLLEEVHGGNASEVTIEELTTLKGAVRVETVKLKHAADGVKHAPTMEAQYLAMCRVNPDEDPVDFPEAEWSRMAEKYGMHLKVALPVVEKVYGSFTNFRRVLRAFKGKGAAPDITELVSGVESSAGGAEPGGEKPIAEMDREELKALLNAASIPFARTATIEKLRELAEEAQGATA